MLYINCLQLSYGSRRIPSITNQDSGWKCTAFLFSDNARLIEELTNCTLRKWTNPANSCHEYDILIYHMYVFNDFQWPQHVSKQRNIRFLYNFQKATVLGGDWGSTFHLRSLGILRVPVMGNPYIGPIYTIVGIYGLFHPQESHLRTQAKYHGSTPIFRVHPVLDPWKMGISVLIKWELKGSSGMFRRGSKKYVLDRH